MDWANVIDLDLDRIKILMNMFVSDGSKMVYPREITAQCWICAVRRWCAVTTA